MPTALVTGAGRGIGRAIALRLAAEGWEVFAGVRREQDGSTLQVVRPDIRPVILDVTSATDLAALDGLLPDRLDAVINNAGVVVGGPMEALPLDELRRQLEVNVIGQVAVTQAVLPRLRAAGGRVVFISSVSGRVVTPLLGAYNASKFAIEAIADVMRLELHPWGVRVIVVEPAQTDTDMWQTAEQELDTSVAALSDEARTLYAEHIEGMRKAIPHSQRVAVPADKVADVTMRALTSSRPRARYIVGASPRAQITLAELMPTPVRDSVLRRQAGVPSRST